MHTEDAGSTTWSGRPLRILLIEDHTDTATSAQMILTMLGHESAVAYTGPGGLEKARSWPPDVVICDIGLPGLDGYQVARAMRQDPATAKAMLVAVTGYASVEARRRVFQAGFHFYMPKPVDWKELCDLLDRARDQGVSATDHLAEAPAAD